jgi:hypothetical protein
MAHLWILDAGNNWAPTLLNGDAFALVDSGSHRANVERADAEAETNARVLLRRVSSVPDTWALLCGPKQPVWVNGLPVPLGLTVLSDRDEIRLLHTAVWFSTETQPHVEPFSESATRGVCPRCKQRIEAGTPAVCCPSCGLWHHASDDLPCWSYAPTCAACAQDTAMDADFLWTPEDL